MLPFHHANAFETASVSEQGGQLVVDSICYDSFPSVEPGADFMETNFEEVPPGQLFRFTANLASGKVERQPISLRPCEFPSLAPAKVGQDARYYYIGVTDSNAPNAPLQAVTKIDLQGEAKSWSAAPRGFISEPLFVPRAEGEAEDDGWVLCLIYNAARHASDLVVLDAKTLQEVARVKLKQHIPYGLHGSFTTETFGVAR